MVSSDPLWRILRAKFEAQEAAFVASRVAIWPRKRWLHFAILFWVLAAMWLAGGIILAVVWPAM